MAGCAFIEKLTVIGRHLYAFAEAAMWARECAFRNDIHNKNLQAEIY